MFCESVEIWQLTYSLCAEFFLEVDTRAGEVSTADAARFVQNLPFEQSELISIFLE